MNKEKWKDVHAQHGEKTYVQLVRENYISQYGITFDENDEAFEQDVEDVYTEIPEEGIER